MKISDILQPDCVRVPLSSTDKLAAIDELADLLVKKTSITDADALKAAVREREGTRTTGIGHGIGIPHGKTESVDTLRLAAGLAPAGLEFEALDGKPVQLVFLLASPSDQTGPHIQALGQLSRMLIDEELRESFKTATDADSFFKLIERYEASAAAV